MSVPVEMKKASLRAAVCALAIGLGFALPSRGAERTPPPPQTHTVAEGETLRSIATRYHVEVEVLMRLNGISDPRSLRLGQTLEIPPAGQGGGMEHTVKPGESLAEIARRYAVGIRALAEENGLEPGAALKPGAVLRIPAELRDGATRGHVVRQGESIASIARQYHVPQKLLLSANHLASPQELRAGRTIAIPDPNDRDDPRLSGGQGVHRPVHFVRNATGEEASIRLVSPRGKLLKAGREKLSRLALSLHTKKVKLLHARLVRLIQRVADHYPGHTIDIISGYRAPKSWPPRSRHEMARAFDFHVRGIQNRDLFAYVKTLPGTGAGYYPNSAFVHMDVRTESMTWCDYSGPGESADYGPFPSKAKARASAAPDPEPEGKMEESLPEGEDEELQAPAEGAGAKPHSTVQQ